MKSKFNYNRNIAIFLSCELKVALSLNIRKNTIINKRNKILIKKVIVIAINK